MDFKITQNGDMILDDEMKFMQVGGDYERYQIALCRVKSISKDWFYDNIGADLEAFLGLPTDEEFNSNIKNAISRALTFDGYFKENDIYIKILYSKNNRNYVKINLYIKSLNGKDSFYINASLDLTKGFVEIGGD